MTATVLLQALVRIPSVNPEGDPGTDCIGEQACAAFLADHLRGLGADASLEEVLPGRPNIVARFPTSASGKPRILFAPHVDTVSVLGMTIDPFGGELRDGRIWGRGASDTKGPMAAMITALAACRDVIPHLSHEIWFAGLVGEEAGQHGARALAAKTHFDFVIAGEPTELRTVHAHKGAAWLTLRAKGRAVHASQPERGENAISAILDALAWLRPELARIMEPLHDPILGSPTFSLGTFRGGSKVNIVPDACEAGFDIRTIPGQNLDPLVAELRERFPGIDVSFVASSPLFTPASHPLVQRLDDCGAPPAGAPWFCDAAVFAATGTPAVALGPGSIAQAHTADEWIAVCDLEAGARFFETFIRSLA